MTNVCRSLNEKIFPILSVTEMSGSFYDVFTASLGCAYLAFVSGSVVSEWAPSARPPATLLLHSAGRLRLLHDGPGQLPLCQGSLLKYL